MDISVKFLNWFFYIFIPKTIAKKTLNSKFAIKTISFVYLIDVQNFASGKKYFLFRLFFQKN